MYTRLITRIETGCYRLGKDDKFQLFVCLAVHDRLLGKIVTDLTKAVAAQHVSGIYGVGQWGLRGPGQWALTIFGKTKTSVFSANKQSSFVSFILEGVLVPPCPAPHA